MGSDRCGDDRKLMKQWAEISMRLAKIDPETLHRLLHAMETATTGEGTDELDELMEQLERRIKHGVAPRLLVRA